MTRTNLGACEDCFHGYSIHELKEDKITGQEYLRCTAFDCSCSLPITKMDLDDFLRLT